MTAKNIANGSSCLPLGIYFCPNCNSPTLLNGDVQTPMPLPGAKVEKLPPPIEALYREARASASAGAFTATALLCRKLLMNVAHSLGAHAGLAFVAYVDFLETGHHVPLGAKDWVDHIRQKGNEATHEIPSISRQDAEELLVFTEMLLKLVYEFPARLRKAPGT